jgi:uncharacterized protein YdeI (YjbR/CyaY-like superfamily)
MPPRTPKILGVKILYPKRLGDFAQWLARHASRPPEVWLVSQKRASGKQTVAYKDALQEALCYGWIDNCVKTVDAERFSLRFTP